MRLPRLFDKRFFIYFLIGVLGACAAAAQSSDKKSFRIEGSAAVARRIMADAAEFGRQKKTGISIIETNSSEGMNCLRNGKCEMALSTMANGDLRTDEKPNYEIIEFDIQPIAVIGHKSNGVDNMTSAQVRGVLGGQIKNWGAVGGSKIPIKVLRRRDARKRELEIFGVDKTSEGLPVRNAVEALNRVSVTPGGFATLAINVFNQDKSQTKSNVQIVKIDGLDPFRTSDRQAYPYSLRMNFVIRKGVQANDTIKALIQYLIDKKQVEK